MPKIKYKSKPWIYKKPAFDMKERDPFYNSTAWRKVRLLYKKKFPLCANCQRKGIIKEARDIDHIIPLKQNGDKFSYSNLQSLCRSCHNRKSARDYHKYKNEQKK
jgi:5-methylcytosine-specific restriction protein A